MPGRRNASLKDPELYEELREDGASKEKAARISNAAAAQGRSAIGRKGGKHGDYEDWTVEQLRKRAKEIGITGFRPGPRQRSASLHSGKQRVGSTVDRRRRRRSPPGSHAAAGTWGQRHPGQSSLRKELAPGIAARAESFGPMGLPAGYNFCQPILGPGGIPGRGEDPCLQQHPAGGRRRFA